MKKNKETTGLNQHVPTNRGDGVVGDSYNTARLFEAFERLTDIVHRTLVKNPNI